MTQAGSRTEILDLNHGVKGCLHNLAAYLKDDTSARYAGELNTLAVSWIPSTSCRSGASACCACYHHHGMPDPACCLQELAQQATNNCSVLLEQSCLAASFVDAAEAAESALNNWQGSDDQCMLLSSALTYLQYLAALMHKLPTDSSWSAATAGQLTQPATKLATHALSLANLSLFNIG
jgi:hypothetical protein